MIMTISAWLTQMCPDGIIRLQAIGVKYYGEYKPEV